MRPLVIIGAGGFGAETAALVEDINRDSPTWSLSGFLDDDSSCHGSRILGYPVLGSTDWLTDRPDHSYVVAIGDPHVRQDVCLRTSAATQNRAATLVHPGASIHESSTIAPGSIVCRGAVLTVRVRAQEHLIVNLNCTIGHDAILGRFTTLHPAVNISGASRTGDCVEVGTGAVLLPGVSVGSGSIIGAGAVVTRCIPPESLAKGVPAKVARELSKPVAEEHA
ncbi:MAG: acetyltransferase [Rhodothermia bacterium]|nr:acetyltransferase [Rhodothermia bacterium]